MKIELTDKTKMHTALSLADKGQFYDALCIFSQVDSYESMINRIMCLCQTEDSAYAVDVYRLAKQKYGLTHALYTDCMKLAENFSALKSVVQFCEPDRTVTLKYEGTIHADKSLLVNFYDEFDDNYPSPDLNYAGDTAMFDDPQYASNNFYDVKSVKYLESLRVNMERCYMEGDDEGAEKYAQRLLDADTDHIPTLEAQISLALYREDYKKGVRFAKRLANTDGGSYASIGGAIEILFKVNDKRLRSTLKKLMTKALAVKEEATLYDLEDFVHIATVHLNDVEMAVQFAQQLYANFKNTSLEALKLCSMAFYNVGNLAMAQEAAFNLLRAVPEDCYAKVLCDYLKQNRPEEELTHFDSSARVFRHFFVPYKLLYFSGTQCYKYLQMPADSQTSEKLMFYIEPIIYNSKAMFLAGKSEEYYENLPFVAQVLGAFPFLDSHYLAFASRQLFSTLCDQGVAQVLVENLVRLHYDGKLFVCITNAYNLVDFSVLGEFAENEAFIRAFATCVTIARRVETQALVDAYNTVKQFLSEKPKENVSNMLAYAMLKVCDISFDDNYLDEYFLHGDEKLYAKYIAESEKQTR